VTKRRQNDRDRMETSKKLLLSSVSLYFSPHVPFHYFSFILSLFTAVKRRFSRCLLTSERLLHPKTTTLLLNTNNNSVGIGELRSALRIMAGYCCKGQWHEPEIKQFLQSRRYIFFLGIMKLHEFQNLFNLNQLVQKFVRWKLLHCFYKWPIQSSITSQVCIRSLWSQLSILDKYDREDESYSALNIVSLFYFHAFLVFRQRALNSIFG
jgi:hypothetical protein